MAPLPDGGNYQRTPDGLDAFMEALGYVESRNNYNAEGPYTGSTYGRAVGRYQIMEKIYGGWAREAGVDPNDRSPAAQDKVARYKMSEYYRRYGSWDLVAVAWFAGPGRADKAKKQGIASVGGIKDMLGTSVASYAQKVVGRMGNRPTNPTQADAAIRNSQRPVNPRQADHLTPSGVKWTPDPELVAQGVPSTLGDQSVATPVMPQATPMEMQTANDQFGQDALGGILATISDAARSGGGQVLDLRSFLGMPVSEAPLGVPAPEPEVAQEAPTTTTTPAPAEDGPMAPPPKHSGFEGLTDTAKAGTQRIMGQFSGLRFTSGYRDPKRNAAAGGVKNSKHLTGQASDLVGTEEEMQAAAAAARAMGAKTLIHDSGSGRHLHIEWP